jgi:starch-binding outer membrane protein, SusD/RagB family
MKTTTKYRTLTLAAIIAVMLSATSCLNEYLDKSPDSGLSESEVFSKYDNFQKYFNAVYNGPNTKMRPYYPLMFNLNSTKFTTDGLTDICDMARLGTCQTIKLGDGQSAIRPFGYNDYSGKEACKAEYAWKILRICNKTIEMIDMLQDATDTEKEDMLAQAYFIRAYVHFDILRVYGAVPYVDKVLGDDDEWDLPAIGEYEYLLKVADDFQTAADHFEKAGKMRRDPNKNLSASDQSRPSGVAALSLKGRALMYAASPLNNPGGDKTRWEDAAKANYEALQTALEWGYQLLPADKMSTNYHGTKYTKEQIWAYYGGTLKYNNSTFQSIAISVISESSLAGSRCPTQNFVDKFETLDGYALNTEEQRRIATEAGSYNEQNPYVNRDPRIDLSVVYNQKKIEGRSNPAPLYVEEDGTTLGDWMKAPDDGSNASATYYYECKALGIPLTKSQNVSVTDPLVRLAEVYLNYAECAFEAYGSSDGKVPGAELTSVEALNVVRDRAGMPPVRDEYCADAETYRSRVKNERNIELCFEGDHYYYDIRRWGDAPALGRSTLYGMRATKLNPGYDAAKYPTGFKYERFELPAGRQITWKEGMNYIQFQKAQLQKMKNYTPKPEW